MQARQITKIAREINKLTLKVIKDKNIGSTQIDMIHLIRHEPGITQKAIAEKLNLDKAAIARSCSSLEKKGYIIKRIRPYSPWQNGKVERSHREDEKILYANNKFYSKNDLINAVKIHQNRYNNTAKICLNFKSPCEVAEENKLLLDL